MLAPLEFVYDLEALLGALHAATQVTRKQVPALKQKNLRILKLLLLLKLLGLLKLLKFLKLLKPLER